MKVDFIPVLKMWVLPILGRSVWTTYFVQCALTWLNQLELLKSSFVNNIWWYAQTHYYQICSAYTKARHLISERCFKHIIHMRRPKFWYDTRQDTYRLWNVVIVVIWFFRHKKLQHNVINFLGYFAYALNESHY